MSISVEIKLNRPNKIYHENVSSSSLSDRPIELNKESFSLLQETISGLVQIHCPSESKHDGIAVSALGNVGLQMGSKSVGIIDAFSNSARPMQLLCSELQLAGAGKLPLGITELAFEFTLTPPKEPNRLYETYHGIFVNVNYLVKCDIKRSFLAKSIQKTQQFVIQYVPEKRAELKEVNFSISPDTLQKSVKERLSIPRFLITGRLDASEWCVTKPFTGHVRKLNETC